MRLKILGAIVSLSLALASCMELNSDWEVKVDTWHSPQGTVQLDYLLGHDAGCKAVTAWLDSIKTSFRDEDTQVRYDAFMVYQTREYLTYYCHLQNLPSDYYEGDQSFRLYTFDRRDGHQLRPKDVTNDLDALSAQVLAHTRLENEWMIETLGGEEAFLNLVKDFTVGITARGLTFCYSVMEGIWQTVCTIPSSEVKMELSN
jgi:hypothetical protein